MGRSRAAFAFPFLVMIAGSAPVDGADRFVRGDANASGRLEVRDAVSILQFLFLERMEGVRCRDAADADDSGRIEVADTLHILNYLFQHGPPPAVPFPFCGGDPGQDEILCETYEACLPVHEVLGIEIAAGGVVFVIDRSGSFTDQGELPRAKRETEEAILAFQDGIEFGVLFTSRDLIRFPAGAEPARADPETRALAVEFIRNMPGGSGSCPRPGLLAALDLARNSEARGDAILFITDGSMTCGGPEKEYLRETVAEVTAANQGAARIYCLGIGVSTDTHRNSLRDLATQNGGEFHDIPLR